MGGYFDRFSLSLIKKAALMAMQTLLIEWYQQVVKVFLTGLTRCW
jgi:hypothetical protein